MPGKGEMWEKKWVGRCTFSAPTCACGFAEWNNRNNKREINLTCDPVHPTARRNAFEISRRLGGKALPTRGRLISKAFLLAVGCTVPSNKGTNTCKGNINVKIIFCNGTHILIQLSLFQIKI